jgi:ferredoxin
MVKILINQKECIGCRLCESMVPKLFKYDEDNFKAKLDDKGNLVDELSVELSAEELIQLKELVANCPVQAISITEIK